VTLLAVLALGFVLGMRHATDADHVVAVTTLVSRERSPRAAIALGALWGLGHSLTLLVVGGAIVVFGLVVPPRLGLSMELSVAVMLIILGTLNLTGAGERLRQGTSHAHAHPSPDPASFTTSALGVLRRGSRSVLIGVVHGLAGSAAVALLVLTTLDQAAWALAYLGVFGAGTVAGMMLITATMALPLKLAMERFSSAERVMARATGALSLAFGIFLAYRIGFVDGLLLGEPKWTPE
jgi:hypothetical protein